MLDTDEQPDNASTGADSAEAAAAGVTKPAKATKTKPRKAATRQPRKTTAAAATESGEITETAPAAAPELAAPRKATRPRKAVAKAAPQAASEAAPSTDGIVETQAAVEAEPTVAAKTPRRRPAKATKATKAAEATTALNVAFGDVALADSNAAEASPVAPAVDGRFVLFQPPSEVAAVRTPRRRGGSKAATVAATVAVDEAAASTIELDDDGLDTEALADAGESDSDEQDSDGTGPSRRRRRRGRRGRGSRSTETDRDSAADSADEGSEDEGSDDEDADEESGEHADEVAEAALSASARRRRRRRRSTLADGEELSEDDPPNTVVHVREARQGRGGGSADSDGVRGVKGSTRLEAKRQRRRDNRDSGRRRTPILTEAEFLARRESVDRTMVVRQVGDRTQIAVLEDEILVEHYVTRASAMSTVGNVFLGRVQNVLPSMEAAFIDIGRGRNGVLYAGEVNWDAAGLEGKARAIEHALNPGDPVLVQVTKDPIGHKGARLTSQISLPGRFVVYVPGGGMTGISRRLPDTERSRLKAILKKVVPDDAGVIVRTAAEGASEADLVSDVERLKAQWDAIEAKAAKTSTAPTLVYGEPDLAIRVVRDVFNDDFAKLIVSGSGIHATISEYVTDVAPELSERIHLHTGNSDVFADLRVDEQLMKALDRKVWLPSGGSLVIDRTEAMTVIDVNTGKYTGSGGNLEQTVTRNNLEAAEEIVRQLRLRDIGGIVVIDFIDMVLESNRELVLRRLTECLGRDRTKHQVAEVTSLGLVQMTRKRVGEGLIEAFSEPCEHCKGRGVIIHTDPVERRANPAVAEDEAPGRAKRTRRPKSRDNGSDSGAVAVPAVAEEQRRAAATAIAAIAAAAAHSHDHDHDHDEDHVVEPGSLPGVAPEVELAAAPVAGAAGLTDPTVPTTDPADPSTGATADSTVDPTVYPPVDPTGGAGRPRRRRAASRPAGPPAPVSDPVGAATRA